MFYRTRTSCLLAATFVVTAVSWSGSVLAQAGGNRKTPRVITLSEVTIVGRVQRPIAAVDVARISPKIALSEARQPFVERIGQAIMKDPF